MDDMSTGAASTKMSSAAGFGVATQALGGVTQAIGAYQEQKALQSNSELNAALTRANERIRQASMAEDIRVTEEQGEAFVGTQVMKVAKSGLKLSGSPLAVIQKSIANIKRDISIMKINASISALQARQESDMQEAQSAYYGRMAWAKSLMSLSSSAASTGLQLYSGK